MTTLSKLIGFKSYHLMCSCECYLKSPHRRILKHRRTTYNSLSPSLSVFSYGGVQTQFAMRFFFKKKNLISQKLLE
jgi:hypothetical protein